MTREIKKTYHNDLNHAYKDCAQGSNLDGKVPCKLAEKNASDHADSDPEGQVGVLLQKVVQGGCWICDGLPGIVETASIARGCRISRWLFGGDWAKAPGFRSAHSFCIREGGCLSEDVPEGCIRGIYQRARAESMSVMYSRWDGAEVRKYVYGMEKGRGRSGREVWICNCKEGGGSGEKRRNKVKSREKKGSGVRLALSLFLFVFVMSVGQTQSTRTK